MSTKTIEVEKLSTRLQREFITDPTGRYAFAVKSGRGYRLIWADSEYEASLCVKPDQELLRVVKNG